MPMRYRQRLEKLRDWVLKTCCEGRSMKTPGKTEYDVAWREPRCFLGNFPASAQGELFNVAPCILILPAGGLAEGDTSQYLDSRSGISRPKDMGATLQVQIVHVSYDPGERTGIRKDDGRADPKQALIINEDADEGMLALIDWMDDTMAALVGAKSITGSDLTIKEDTVGFEPFKENGALADRRPYYLGHVTVEFASVTHRTNNEEIEALL